MEETKMKDMTEILDYYKGKRPDFARRIRGASDEEIGALEGLVGRSLNEDYKIFLKYLGNDNGGIFDSATYELKYDFTIGILMKHYRWLRGKEKRSGKKMGLQNRFNEKFILIGTQAHSEDHGSYYLDCRAPGEPAVVNIDEFNEVVPLTPSLRDFILKYAFKGERF